MRELIIQTIEQNFAEGLDEIGRNIFPRADWGKYAATLFEIKRTPQLLNPFLKSLPDDILLGVLDSQLCQKYR